MCGEAALRRHLSFSLLIIFSFLHFDMIFISTCSQDVTVDLLLPELRDLPTFRFNIDQPKDYTWDFSRNGFEITDLKNGASISTRTLSSFYRRKPVYFETIDIPKAGCLENWCREETSALFDDFYRLCEAKRLTTLIHSRDDHYGKLRQLLVAENYFKVSHWHIFHGVLPDELKHGKWVAKALTGTPIGEGKMYFVKEVDPTALDLAYPWFLQEKIDGDDEVTVVYVNGQLFSYRYPRSSIADCDDVRKATFENPSKWEPCELSRVEQSAIRGFMAETSYRFGRFDFIRKDGELWFLELNPNGQWAWLDEANENGLISAIADAIITEDRRHQHSSTVR